MGALQRPRMGPETEWLRGWSYAGRFKEHARALRRSHGRRPAQVPGSLDGDKVVVQHPLAHRLVERARPQAIACAVVKDVAHGAGVALEGVDDGPGGDLERLNVPVPRCDVKVLAGRVPRCPRLAELAVRHAIKVEHLASRRAWVVANPAGAECQIGAP